MNAPEIIVPTTTGGIFGGGIYAGRFGIGDKLYGLVVAPAAIGELVKTKWGGLKKVAGADSYNDGDANTQAMAAAGSVLGKWARGLLIEGFGDWYIPSRLESLILLGELGATDTFARDWYWTSTQYDAEWAWSQLFDDGDQDSHHKDCQLRARAVRRFPIQ